MKLTPLVKKFPNTKAPMFLVFFYFAYFHWRHNAMNLVLAHGIYGI